MPKSSSGIARRTVGREKRSHPRVAVEISVSCERRDSPPILGTGRDIGIGGIFIESAEVLSFGTEVVIVARLPGASSEARLPGVVRWSKPNGFGVQFGSLGARETHAILTIVK